MAFVFVLRIWEVMFVVKKKGAQYKCEECGLVVTVDQPCGCEDCALVCCEVPMKEMKPKKK